MTDRLVSKQEAFERILEAKRERRRELARVPLEENFRMVVQMNQLSRAARSSMEAERSNSKKGERVPRSTEEPILRLASPAAWDAWLATNHGSESGVHLAIGKKGGDGPALAYAEAVDVALAWGWIDGQRLKHDDDVFLQRFSRRRARSPWSKINREKADALIRAGKMHAPGLAEVERAKKDGRWDAAYDSARTSTIPADLAAALAADEPAQAFFEQIDSANRYAILYRVQTAKKAETRQQRIARFVAMLARRELIHPPKRKARRSR